MAALFCEKTKKKTQTILVFLQGVLGANKNTRESVDRMLLFGFEHGRRARLLVISNPPPPLVTQEFTSTARTHTFMYINNVVLRKIFVFVNNILRGGKHEFIQRIVNNFHGHRAVSFLLFRILPP